jgi:hypothetical protein
MKSKDDRSAIDRLRVKRPIESATPTLVIDDDTRARIVATHKISPNFVTELVEGRLCIEDITARCQNYIGKTGLADTPLGRDLTAFAQRRTNYGLTLVRGAPENVPAVATLVFLANLIGLLHHVPEEGPPIIQVREKPGASGGRPSSANNRPFTTHTDLSYTPDRPHFMILQAERNFPETCGYSVFADVGSAVMRLMPSTVAMLCSDNYLFPAPDHFKGGKVVRAPILQRDDEGKGHFYVRFRRDELQAATREAMLAVMEFIAALEAVKVELLLENNTMAVVDNWRVLHGRTGYLSDPSPDRARILNRVYVRPPLAA